METLQQVILIITTGISLLCTAGGIAVAVWQFLKNRKNATIQDNWKLIVSIVDKIMPEVNKLDIAGADKKAKVIEATKVGAKAIGIDIAPFMEQLSAYIDDTKGFVNKFIK